MTRPPVYRGMLITPEILLQLAADEGGEDWKRFKAHASGFERGMPAHTHTLSVDFLQWAARAGYDMEAFGKLLFPSCEPRDSRWNAQAIWDALPEAPTDEIPELPKFDAGRPCRERYNDIVTHFTARFDALEKKAREQDVRLSNYVREHRKGLHGQQDDRIGKLEGILRDMGPGWAAATNRVLDERGERIEKLEDSKTGRNNREMLHDIRRRIEGLEKKHQIPAACHEAGGHFGPDETPPSMQPETPVHAAGNVTISTEPDDPFAAGKFAVYLCPGEDHREWQGAVVEIIEPPPAWVGDYRIRRTSDGLTGISKKQFLTPLDGTLGFCELEEGDIGSFHGDPQVKWRVCYVHRNEYAVLSIWKHPRAGVSAKIMRPHDRSRFRLVRRPPKGEGK